MNILSMSLLLSQSPYYSGNIYKYQDTTVSCPVLNLVVLPHSSLEIVFCISIISSVGRITVLLLSITSCVSHINSKSFNFGQ